MPPKNDGAKPAAVKIASHLRGDDELRKEWGNNLRRLMHLRGFYNQSAFARLVGVQRGNINHYLQGTTLPNDGPQVALAMGLKVSPEELMAPYLRAANKRSGLSDFPTSDLAVQMVGDDRAHIHLDKEIPWATAVEILNLLKKDA